MQQQQHLLKLQGCICITWVWSDRFFCFSYNHTRGLSESSRMSWADSPKDSSQQSSTQGCRAGSCWRSSGTAWRLLVLITFQPQPEGNPHITVPPYFSVLSRSWSSSHYLFFYLFTVSYFTPPQWCPAQLSFVLLPSYPQHQIPPASSS